jgi:hypothetical protein
LGVAWVFWASSQLCIGDSATKGDKYTPEKVFAISGDSAQ